MPPLTSALKLAVSLVSRKNGVRLLTSLAKNNQLRFLNGVNDLNAPSVSKSVGDLTAHNFSIGSGGACRYAQSRRFLGFNDDASSKVYDEKRVLGYTTEQLFNVVAAVDMYHGFVPWCQRSDIIKHYPDGSFDAELEIGFNFFIESYVSHVELNKDKSVKTTVSQSSLFDYLINTWEFNPGKVPGTCELNFLVDFKFKSPLYRQMSSVFFKEVVSRLVGSFSDRCRLLYGPGVPVFENSYR